MNKQEIEAIHNDAYDIAIMVLGELFKDKSLIPIISESEIMDKKYKAGLFKGIGICIKKIKDLKD